ncbi:MAG: hypothetical protein ABSE69_00195 [Roseiarcus sp.]|jgi:hypothetical protein
MRKLLLLGTTGLVLALGAVEANAIPLLNKDATPYAVLNQQAQPSNGIVSVIEGRSAFTGEPANGATPVVTPRLQGRSYRPE